MLLAQLRVRKVAADAKHRVVRWLVRDHARGDGARELRAACGDRHAHPLLNEPIGCQPAVGRERRQAAASLWLLIDGGGAAAGGRPRERPLERAVHALPAANHRRRNALLDAASPIHASGGNASAESGEHSQQPTQRRNAAAGVPVSGGQQAKVLHAV